MTQASGASMGADKPFFRYDLQTEAVVDGGQRFVDVVDPNGGASFRFFEVEYAVACGMDGERDLEAIVAWAKSELDLATTTDEVGAIVSKLSELKYLGGDVQPPELGPTPDVVATMPRVAAAPASSVSGIDVELGESGKSPIAPERAPTPASGVEFELGLAGAGAKAPPAASSASEDMLLGAAGNEDLDEEPTQVQDEIKGPSREVSTDLSQTFRIDKDEVKAAVRASKVMSAVELPEDLEDELTKVGGSEEAAEAEAKLAAEARGAAAVPENVAPISDISDSIADEAETDASGGDAIVLPEEPAKVAAAAEEPEKKKKKKQLGPKRNSASMVLWVLLLLAVAGGAAYYYMEYVREQPEEKGPTVTPQQAAARRQAQEAAVKPKPTTGKLTVTEAPTAEIAATRDGVVSWIIESSSEVAEGDELVKFSGVERLEKTIERHEKSLETYEAQLEAARGKSESRTASLESNVARKKLDIQMANEKRDAFLIKAPIAGVVEVLVKSGGRIKTGTPIAKVTGTASATATFVLPKGVSAAVDDELEVVSLEDSELKANCTVAEVDGQKATLSCPADSGLGDGAGLQLTLPPTE